jgi:K+ transporter
LGDAIARPANAASLSALGLSALGVVFGDIGTSPLYTLKTVLSLTGGAPDAAVTLGVLSLVIWTLIVVTTIKYVSVAMRVDNDGEGGILALMSLLGVKRQHRPMIIAFGLFGAALILMTVKDAICSMKNLGRDPRLADISRVDREAQARRAGRAAPRPHPNSVAAEERPV